MGCLKLFEEVERIPWQVHKKGESSSKAYVYAYNNPVNFSDPAGLVPRGRVPIPTAVTNEHERSGGNGGSRTGWNNFSRLLTRHNPANGNYWSNYVHSANSNAGIMSTNNWRGLYGVNDMTDEEVAEFASQIGTTVIRGGEFVSPKIELLWERSIAYNDQKNVVTKDDKLGFGVGPKRPTINWNSFIGLMIGLNGGGQTSGGNGGNMPLEYLGVINDLALSTATAYNSLDNDIKRRYAYKLSKRTNVKSGKIFQTAKSFGKSSARILGKTANVIAVGSIAYDFGTGDANTATLVDAGILVGGVVAVAVLGTVAAPYVIAAGVAYGVSSLFGFDDYLNETFDISGSINFIEKSP